MSDAIARQCGYGSEQEMEDAMGVPPGGLAMVKSLTTNLIMSARAENKNMLTLEGTIAGDVGTVSLIVHLTKDQTVDPPPQHIEHIRVTREGAEQTWKQMLVRIVMMCREFDALTDMDLNTLGNPFFPKEAQAEVLENDIGEALMEFGLLSQQELAIALTVLTGMNQGQSEAKES